MVSNRDRIVSAFFYGISSLLVVFVNKILLSSYNFPSFLFLACMQFVATCMVLAILTALGYMDIPRLSFDIMREVLPVSLLFLGNVISGLGSTQALNLPMFTALRRFSILMTMIGEYLVLATVPSTTIAASVGFMVGGAMIAAMFDLTFNPLGYFYILLNDLFTALNGVYLKKASSSNKCSKMTVLYYNSAFSCFFVFIFFTMGQMYYYDHNTGNAEGSEMDRVLRFKGWSDPYFLILFILAAGMGSVLNYSIFLCTSLNSALTTAVVGCLKNVLTTYVSMFTLPDYTFSLVNFIGLNVSIGGSLLYTYAVLYAKKPNNKGAGVEQHPACRA
jgi:solute carrier family 35 protein